MESRCGRFAVSILALSGASRPCRVAAPSIRFARACVLLAAAPTATPCFRHWRRSSPLPPKGEPFGYTSTTFYHTFPLATRLNGQKTAKMGKKVEKMRSNHSAAAPQSHKTLGKKTPESPKIPLQLGCSVTQIRHFFKRTFFNLPLIFENNVKKATVWLHERGETSPSMLRIASSPTEGRLWQSPQSERFRQRLPY